MIWLSLAYPKIAAAITIEFGLAIVQAMAESQ